MQCIDFITKINVVVTVILLSFEICDFDILFTLQKNDSHLPNTLLFWEIISDLWHHNMRYKHMLNRNFILCAIK